MNKKKYRIVYKVGEYDRFMYFVQSSDFDKNEWSDTDAFYTLAATNARMDLLIEIRDNKVKVIRSE